MIDPCNGQADHINAEYLRNGDITTFVESSHYAGEQALRSQRIPVVLPHFVRKHGYLIEDAMMRVIMVTRSTINDINNNNKATCVTTQLATYAYVYPTSLTNVLLHLRASKIDGSRLNSEIGFS